jgi:cephalosporin-C deacetylase-like acetyl esterase
VSWLGEHRPSGKAADLPHKSALRVFLTVALALPCVAVPLYAQTPTQDGAWAVTPTGQVWDLPNTEPNAPALIKSLGDAAEYVLRWKVPADNAAWQQRRPEVAHAFRQAIGLEVLPERTPLNARTTAHLDMGDYDIDNVIFESRPGFLVTANLYRPKADAAGKRPAVLCPIGHYIIEGKSAPDVQARCIKLARMGFVVLTYDAIGQGERNFPGNIHHEAGFALLPLGQTIAGWMVWDSIRGIDYLLTLPDVDPKRIGVTGNSGGGLNTLFTAALDERVRAAVVVGFTFEFNNWLKYAGTHCTCTHLPGMLRGMEWFEIAGLIAPRALMMLQGDQDGIFPISGARRAGHNTEAIYALTGHPSQARFTELASQPHAYSRPYREVMYGWMAEHLLGKGTGEPIPEGDVRTLGGGDVRLRCDPGGSIMPHSPTVVQLARQKALGTIAKMPEKMSERMRTTDEEWLRGATLADDAPLTYLAPHNGEPTPVPGGTLEKISVVSEDGEPILGLLWLPLHRIAPARTVIIADSRGKQAVAQSDLVRPLLASGMAVLAVDLRGRGETLGHMTPDWDTNFRLAANQIDFGRPLPGRRAFDLIRTVDYVHTRRELASEGLAVVGLGDDALSAILAAAADPRIQSVAVASYFHSFISQMRPMEWHGNDLGESWNDAQLKGVLKTPEYDIDLGSVIPSALLTLDVPDLVAMVAPRKVLFCHARDAGLPGTESLVARFRHVTEAVSGDWISYAPTQLLDGETLRSWLQNGGME